MATTNATNAERSYQELADEVGNLVSLGREMLDLLDGSKINNAYAKALEELLLKAQELKQSLIVSAFDYEVEGAPTQFINPTMENARWLDLNTALIYVCKDNTPDNNVWISASSAEVVALRAELGILQEQLRVLLKNGITNNTGNDANADSTDDTNANGETNAEHTEEVVQDCGCVMEVVTKEYPRINVDGNKIIKFDENGEKTEIILDSYTEAETYIADSATNNINAAIQRAREAKAAEPDKFSGDKKFVIHIISDAAANLNYTAVEDDSFIALKSSVPVNIEKFLVPADTKSFRLSQKIQLVGIIENNGELLFDRANIETSNLNIINKGKAYFRLTNLKGFFSIDNSGTFYAEEANFKCEKQIGAVDAELTPFLNKRDFYVQGAKIYINLSSNITTRTSLTHTHYFIGIKNYGNFYAQSSVLNINNSIFGYSMARDYSMGYFSNIAIKATAVGIENYGNFYAQRATANLLSSITSQCSGYDDKKAANNSVHNTICLNNQGFFCASFAILTMQAEDNKSADATKQLAYAIKNLGEMKLENSVSRIASNVTGILNEGIFANKNARLTFSVVKNCISNKSETTFDSVKFATEGKPTTFLAVSGAEVEILDNCCLCDVCTGTGEAKEVKIAVADSGTLILPKTKAVEWITNQAIGEQTSAGLIKYAE